MNIQDVKTVLKELVNTKTPVTPMLWGRHGIGKSSAVHQLGKELGYRVYTIILSQKEPVDVAGVLYTFDDKQLGMSVTASHPPDWFATALKKGKCILFLDEFNMARREVMNAAFELVLDRRLNNLKLPDDVFIVCAGNPDDERYDVTPMSESLRDRLMHLKVTPDVNTWLKFAKGKDSGIHPDIVTFVEMNPKAGNSVDSRDDVFPVEIKHSFRSWERVGLIHSLTGLSNVLKAECIRGIVGTDLATAFIQAFGSMDRPLGALDILELNAATINKISVLRNPKKMRIDILTQSIDNLAAFCHSNETLATKKIENVIKFIKLLPEDCASLTIGKLFEIPTWAEMFMQDSELKVKIDMISEATELKRA